MPYKEGKKFRGVVTKDKLRYTRLFNTKREAVDWESQKRKELKTQMKTGMDLLQLCNLYGDHCQRFAYHTRAHKKACCKRLLQMNGNIATTDITPIKALQFLDGRSKLSGDAANEDMKNLSAMWKFGIKYHDMPSNHNPWTGINPYPHRKKNLVTPSRDTVLKLVFASSGMDRVFINVLRFTGARKSSVLHLVWDDVNFQNKTVTTWHRKGRKGEWKSVTVPMNKTLYESLFWWWSNRVNKETPFVFTRSDGQPYQRRDDFVMRLCKKAGVEYINGYHALRRYYASRLIDSKKATMKDAQELLGHSSMRTTELYIKNINPHHRDIMEVVDDDEIHDENTHYNKGDSK